MNVLRVDQGAVARQGGASTVPVESGWRVYRDPQTGDLVDPPAVSDPFLNGPSGVGGTERLAQRPGPTRAGGILVDLQGRFDSSTRATRDLTGEPAIECTTDDHERSQPGGQR